MDQATFQIVIVAWIALAVILFPIQLKITAPYGRHNRAGIGPQMSSRLGWIIMESVSLFVFAALFLAGGTEKTTPMWIFFFAWVAHYTHRSFVFPLHTRTTTKTIPLVIVLAAAAFNIINGALNGGYLGFLSPSYPETWLTDPRLIIGLGLFLIGAAINIWSDYHLIALRDPQAANYKIPRGGLFEKISCPNHFGEIIEWVGFAIMCWNLPALSFAIWTAANLIPRAISHHKWYKKRFSDYPENRKAIIPYLV